MMIFPVSKLSSLQRRIVQRASKSDIKCQKKNNVFFNNTSKGKGGRRGFRGPNISGKPQMLSVRNLNLKSSPGAADGAAARSSSICQKLRFKMEKTESNRPNNNK